MIWIVLFIAMLCIVMSCVALRCREKWQEAKESYVNMSDMFYEMKEKYNNERDERERFSCSLGALNIELESAKERLKRTEFYQIQHEKDNEVIARTMGRAYDMGLRFDGDFNVLVDMLLNAYPKRDSKGRFCKRKE